MKESAIILAKESIFVFAPNDGMVEHVKSLIHVHQTHVKMEGNALVIYIHSSVFAQLDTVEIIVKLIDVLIVIFMHFVNMVTVFASLDTMEQDILAIARNQLKKRSRPHLLLCLVKVILVKMAAHVLTNHRENSNVFVKNHIAVYFAI